MAVPGKQKTMIWVGPHKIIVVLRGGVRGPKSLERGGEGPLVSGYEIYSIL